MQFPNISPVAFYILGFPIRWYALAYIIGFILAFHYIKYILRHSTNNQMSYADLDDLFTYEVLGIILGGRIGYTIFYNFDYYSKHLLHIFALWEGGMSFHGGLLGCIVALFVWCKKNKKSFLYIADIICMSGPIGLFFGRLANFVNGELYGRITTSKLGIIFPNTNGLPRHPSQIYEAIAEGILLFTILFFLRKVKAIRNRYGTLAFAFLGLYGIARVGVENFREPDVQIGFLKYGLTMGQLLSIPMIAISIISICFLFKRKQKMEIYTSSPFLDTTSTTTRFFTRQYGVSTGVFASANCKFETSDNAENIRENRKLLISTIGLDAETSLITVNQQHTNEVVVITSPVVATQKFLNMNVDGVITNQPNLAVGILTADCVPLLVSDEKVGFVGAIHCGWQGIYKDIVHTSITKLKTLGCNVKNIRVALGPCLKKQSYEVDEDFVKKIVAQNKKFTCLFSKKSNGKFLFDCTKFCVLKLKDEGVLNKNIEVLDFNTYTQSDLFFSYRRSLLSGDYATSPTDEGRQLSIIVKNKR